jgi:hypothetical protein
LLATGKTPKSDSDGSPVTDSIGGEEPFVEGAIDAGAEAVGLLADEDFNWNTLPQRLQRIDVPSKFPGIRKTC